MPALSLIVLKVTYNCSADIRVKGTNSSIIGNDVISLEITDSNRDTGRVNMTHTDLLTNKERRLDFELRYYKSYVKAKNDTEESHKSGGLYIFKS